MLREYNKIFKIKIQKRNRKNTCWECVDVSMMTFDPAVLSLSPGHRGEALGPRRKLYSAVPGRHFVVVRSYTVQAEGEINLYKGDRVKGEKRRVGSFLL